MEFWKLNLKEIGILEILKNYFKKIKLRIEFQKIKFKKIGILENWNFEKLFLKVNLRVEFWKLNFENWNLGKIILRMEFWKIQILKNYLKIEICFGKLIKKMKF